ncbi:hypothetical protein GLP25_18190 [Photobacterium phosphoreum]|uniref:O-antigen polymerase n=1 Tax=Photobacterium phosphoreum TaxID=659 RepID=UPI001E578DB6|nr:O-antigen polymerase [Photobacterium phosphoreum]MCD9480546.1 hypothetical protein [Photobacterium phosphoreum]MCD9485096.1 hypothetical protein [Photobacterium phosphoreum]
MGNFKNSKFVSNYQFLFHKCYMFLPLIIMYELILGGGGRLFHFGFFSPRMFLFILAIFISIIFYFKKNKVAIDVLIYNFTLLTYLSCSIIIGFLNGNALTDIFVDVKPLAYLFLLNYIYITPYIENNILKVIKISSLILGGCYFLILIVMRFDLIPFNTIYLLNKTGEFYFRGQSGFVYKGFLYLLLGTILFLFEKENKNKKKDILIFCFLFVCLYFTYARGYIITFFVIVLFKWMLDSNIKSKIALLTSILILPVLIYFYMSSFTDRGNSDSFRLNDLTILYHHFSNLVNLVVGSGFGSYIGNRQQVEYSLLDILFKSGFIGLFFWISLYLYIFISYFKFKNEFSLMLLLLTTATYVQSSFNPYINNPIGMFIIMVSLSYFIRLQVNDKRMHCPL